jgi:DNA-directed RNA polymerase specialized sigma24 family protein
MVLGFCRRILADSHVAEDAFQATFHVLVRQAGSIRVDGSLGRWWYRVATRARAIARRREARVRSGLRSVDVGSRDTSTTTTELADIQTILAEELEVASSGRRAIDETRGDGNSDRVSSGGSGLRVGSGRRGANR